LVAPQSTLVICIASSIDIILFSFCIAVLEADSLRLKPIGNIINQFRKVGVASLSQYSKPEATSLLPLFTA